MSESKFRERRSAHGEESSPKPAPVQIVETIETGARGEDAGPIENGEPGLDIDRLADVEVPEPSFLEMLEPHVEMALRFLGQLPLTPDGERRVLPQWAKREIDLLAILEQRTQGNLPPDEQRYLQQALDELRTLYLKLGT